MKIASVRVIEPQQKSSQEIEGELLRKKEEENQNLNNNDLGDNSVIQDNNPITQEPSESNEDNLSDDQVLKYLGKRYNKQINSFDELMNERESSEELPEDVSMFLKYKKETGRGIDDFVKVNRDYEKMDEHQLVKDYLMATNDGLDEDDIDVMMDKYEYDEEFDDESRVKTIKLERKQKVNEAKKYFNSLKDKYKVPLESRPDTMSNQEKEEFEAYRNYTKQAKTSEEEANRKRQWFSQKTDELFNDEFKGFEFSINDKKITFNPGNATEIKKIQSNPQNFISKFLDESGLLKDAAGYHKSLAVAMNPDKFARYFYEQGVANATEDVNKKIKNINMSERRAPEFNTQNNGGIRVRELNPDSGMGLKIRSKK